VPSFSLIASSVPSAPSQSTRPPAAPIQMSSTGLSGSYLERGLAAKGLCDARLAQGLCREAEFREYEVDDGADGFKRKGECLA
jgi:hypothetical protein